MGPVLGFWSHMSPGRAPRLGRAPFACSSIHHHRRHPYLRPRPRHDHHDRHPRPLHPLHRSESLATAHPLSLAAASPRSNLNRALPAARRIESPPSRRCCGKREGATPQSNTMGAAQRVICLRCISALAPDSVASSTTTLPRGRSCIRTAHMLQKRTTVCDQRSSKRICGATA